MNVYPVSNGQINYKGYVDKSVEKYVETLVQKQCNIYVAEANKNLQKVDYFKLKNLYEKGKNIIETLKEFITPMQKDTCIDINNGYLEISNPIAKKNKISIFSSNHLVEEEGMLNVCVIWLKGNHNLNKYSGLDGLNILEQMANTLKEKVNPQAIDKAFLDFAENAVEAIAKQNGAGFWGKFKTKRAVNKIKKYAEDINQEPSSDLNAESLISKVKQEKKIKSENEKMKKALKNKNHQLMDGILNQ